MYKYIYLISNFYTSLLYLSKINILTIHIVTILFVKLVHNSSAGKLVFSLKSSVVTINVSGIVIQELSGLIVHPFIFSIQMNSISKGNNLNFPRILVRRTILNRRRTPESTIL